MLLRERATVFTQDCSDPAINTNPEFVFKGKGTRTKLVLDGNVKYQWSVSGFYREKNTLKTISNLPDRFNPFTQKDFAIYVLDDYAVHITQEIRKACCQRGYVLVVMGGGITGFIKANGTHLHHHLKGKYRSKEMELMIKKLEVDKVPSPSREDMVQMLLDSWKENEVHYLSIFKKLFVTNKFDGTEDYLVSEKLF